MEHLERPHQIELVDRRHDEDDEVATRMPGHRASWIIAGGGGGPTVVASRWLWEVEPGDELLYVQQDDGLAGQPVVRKRKTSLATETAVIALGQPA